VQQYTLDEYGDKFAELKKALSRSGFDISSIAFRENEEKAWNVVEVVQRMSCFLRERWKLTQPASMYRSKGKALELYTNDATRPEFQRPYEVIVDVITFPEFIQSEFSRGGIIQRGRLGKLRAVKPLKKTDCRPGTSYDTDHRMDAAALLPTALSALYSGE